MSEQCEQTLRNVASIANGMVGQDVAAEIGAEADAEIARLRALLEQIAISNSDPSGRTQDFAQQGLDGVQPANDTYDHAR